MMSRLSFSICNGELLAPAPPSAEVAVGSRRAVLFGSADFLADFRGLTLSHTDETAISQVLRCLCDGDLPERIHRATELFGAYVIVILRDDNVEYVYKSDDNDRAVYCAKVPGGYYFDTDWVEAVRRSGNSGLSIDDLEVFSRSKSVRMHRTLFPDVSILKSYGLYRYDGAGLHLYQHAFPGFHTIDHKALPKYDLDDYLKAVGALKDVYPSFSVAYSGGVDSHLLATLYGKQVEELICLRFAEPFRVANRDREIACAARAAKKLGVGCREVVIDLTSDEDLETYYRHYVNSCPFSAFFAVHYYALAVQASAPVILHGQNADNMWDWGFHQIYLRSSDHHSTSATLLRNRLSVDRRILLDRSARLSTRVRRIMKRYVTRYAMIHSFNRMWLRGAVELSGRFGDEYRPLQRFPYKMFVLRRYVNYCRTGESTVWWSSADFASKRSYSPYVNPLALHVNSHLRRRNFLDIKSPFRRWSSEFDPSVTDLCPSDLTDGRPLEEAPLFAKLSASPLPEPLRSDDAAGILKKVANPIIQSHARLVFEQLNTAGSGR